MTKRTKLLERQKEMCMVVTNFMTTGKLKKTVQKILNDLSLPINIDLRDFYKMAPETLELTFLAVNKNNKKMRLINQKTDLQMPVWAAVVIGSSLSMLFPLVKVEPAWSTDGTVGGSVCALENLFGDGKELRSTNFISATSSAPSR